MQPAPLHAVLIVAAGRGSRAGAGPAKQYRRIGGEPVLRRTLARFSGEPRIGAIQVVIHPDDTALYEASIEGLDKLCPPVFGGAARQDSVRLGLEALAPLGPAAVLIHDAARPFVSSRIIMEVLDALEAHDGALAALPVTDTLKQVADGHITATLPREHLWRAQTPQGFRFRPIRDAHAQAAKAGRDDFTDDAAVAEWAGLDVTVVMGSGANVKLTTSEDIRMADEQLNPAGAHEFRTGTGFDVHAFTAGSHVTLCGIDIPHTLGLKGHSDADVAMHALTDALLGALAEADIGAHFPPSDSQWKDAPSRRFLSHAADLIAARGGQITHVDVTIICEAPKIGPHREAMRSQLAEILGLEPGRVSVKATTTEGLGFAGRREGIAAQAAATLRLPLTEPV